MRKVLNIGVVHLVENPAFEVKDVVYHLLKDLVEVLERGFCGSWDDACEDHFFAAKMLREGVVEDINSGRRMFAAFI